MIARIWGNFCLVWRFWIVSKYLSINVISRYLILIIFVDIKRYLWDFFPAILSIFKVILIIFDCKLGRYWMSILYFLSTNIAFFGRLWGADFKIFLCFFNKFRWDPSFSTHVSTKSQIFNWKRDKRVKKVQMWRKSGEVRRKVSHFFEAFRHFADLFSFF